MTRPVFGIDEPPPPATERMAYVARMSCGHIVIAQADTRPASLADFVSHLVPGLTIERIPSAQVRDEGIGGCPVCEPPEQIRAGL